MKRTDIWARHDTEWRDPAQVVSLWRDAANVDGRLLRSRATGRWWELLEDLGITLLVTREYEHLVVALSAPNGQIRQTFLAMPHPSGLTIDRENERVFLASTRNPNQVFTLRPVRGVLDRSHVADELPQGNPLTPVSSEYYPGCLYLHDLAIVSGRLFANAVGQNAVVRLDGDGQFERVWWPRSIERKGRPRFDRNEIQLNSIAAGPSIRQSFFTASSARIGRRRPGHLDYRVDGFGVVFSGRSREPICEGLTRPHSARLWKNRIWLANSGYGELGFVHDGHFETAARLPGWPRGLCITSEIAFVATSRVIPAYACYAPGLDIAKSRCAVHAVSLKTGEIIGSLEWPPGNQVFAVDWISDLTTHGFVFEAGRRRTRQERNVFHRAIT
jgi:uncharacterized protein (TIGR03032 family)